MVTPAAKRDAVAHLRRSWEVSDRGGACAVIGTDRNSVRYRSRRADDGPVRAQLRDVAAIRRRFGFSVCRCCWSAKASGCLEGRLQPGQNAQRHLIRSRSAPEIQWDGTLRSLGVSRPVPLHHRVNKAQMIHARNL